MALTKITGGVIDTGTSITALGATFTGSVSVAGTITYDDVTNIDSVGLITARSGVVINSGGLIVAGVTTVSAGSTSAPSISPSGDTNTGIFFPSADTINASTGGTSRITIDSNGDITLTGDLYVPLASASAPSISFSGDPNTGIYSPGADQLAITTGGTGRLFVDANGCIGVGTSSLNISGGSAGTAALTLKASASLRNSIIELVGTRSSADQVSSYIRSFSNAATSPGVDLQFWRGTTDTDGYLSIHTSGTERLRITSAGLVGVGTSAPSSSLHVSASVTNSNGAGSEILRVANTRVNTGSSGAGLLFVTNEIAGTDQYPRAQITGEWGADGASNTNGRLLFATTNTSGTLVERMRLDHAGRLGVGTTSPSVPLEVTGTSGANISIFRTNDATAANNAGGGFYGVSSGTASSRYAQLWLDADGANFSGGDYFYIQKNGNSGSVQIIQQSNAGMEFHTNGTHRAQIDSSGRLLVGTTSVYADSAELFESYKSSGTNRGWTSSGSLADGDDAAWGCIGGVSGLTLRQTKIGIYKHSGIATPCAYMLMQATNADSYYYWTDNTSMFRISTLASNIGTTGGTVVGTQTSDERIKNILGPVEYGLETIKQINPVRYSLKVNPESEKLGFIAQQVRPLVPESVYDTNEPIEGEPEDAPTKLGMEYVSLIPVLVNAIKELSAEVDALKAQLQSQ